MVSKVEAGDEPVDPRLYSKARRCIEQALEFTLPTPFLRELLGDLYRREGLVALAHRAYLEAYKQTPSSLK
jgi:hypothetical protein